MSPPAGPGPSPRLLVSAACVGLAGANLIRVHTLLGAVAVGTLAALAPGASSSGRLVVLAALAAVAGCWWGSARLDALDRSVLRARVDRAERSVVVVTGPARRARFELRVPVRVRRFGAMALSEASLLELPLGRSPPQGAVLEVVCTVRLPHGPAHGFDERTWLKRHGIHVVLRADRWRLVGRRGGLGGVADSLRRRLAASIAPGLHGERRAVVEGVVLGDEQAVPEDLRQAFRASGLYHLLAVSGQNVALVAGGVLMLAWLIGLPRWLAELGGLAGIGAYVLAVGAQPSVVRAGIAGALGSLAWLTARPRDRWHFLLLGALALLAWNPYVVFDAGFQLSFAAVAAIFVFVPPLQAVLAGYPIPDRLATVIAVSTACGALTAPILWLQFKAVPLLTVPANVFAAPALPPLLGFGLAAAVLNPVFPSAAAALSSLAGLCAAYLAACARVTASLPFAQLQSGPAFGLVLFLAAAGAYAWRRGRAEGGLPPERQ